MKPKIEIHATDIIRLANGRKISVTKAAGSIPDGVHKDGSPRVLSYAAGSPILGDDDGRVICGPIDFQGAKEFAVEIVNGNHRAATEMGASLRLATALLAIMDTLDFVAAIHLVVPAEVEEAL